MIKKLALLLSSFTLLLLNLLASLIQVNAEDITTSISTTSNSNIAIENGIKYYDGKIFDYPTLSNSTLEMADIYEEDNTTRLNHYLENYRYGATKPYYEYEECEEVDLLGDNSILNYALSDNIITLDNYDYNILKHNNDNGDYGLMIFNRTITKNIYFDTDIKTISFYVEHNETAYDYLLAFNDMFNSSFEIPLLIIDDNEYLGIRFNGKDNGFQLYTNNAVLDIAKNYSDNSSGVCNYIAKVTIPRVDYFKEISYTYFYDFQLASLESNSVTIENLSYEKMYFAFDTEMSNKFYDYSFDIKSVNLKDKYFVVNQTSYSNIYLEDEKIVARLSTSKFHSVTFEITYSKKIYNSKTPYNLCSSYLSEYPEYTCSVTNSTLKSGDTLILVQLRGTYEVDIDNNVGYVDGLVKYVYFEDFELPDNFNDYSFKIKQINFYPYVTGMGDLSKYNFIQDYSMVNYQKYTCSVDKTMNVFYYSGDMKENIQVWNSVNTSGSAWIQDIKYLRDINNDIAELLGHRYRTISQNISFTFYFDEERTLRIPNVKKISFKYQKGFKDSNPNELNGFYLEDKYKDTITYKTLDMNLDIFDNGVSYQSEYEIDETMSLSRLALLSEPKEKLYDFVFSINNIYTTNKKNDSSYFVNAFSPIEIYYETAEYETIKLVGNSQGLHVIYDEYGNANVYDGDGNLKLEYGVFTDEQGYSFPAQDLNGDGIYSSNEVINSDTGEWESLANMPEESKSDFESLFNKVEDFFSKLGKKLSTLGQALTLILGILGIITIYVFIINPIIKWIIAIFKKIFKKKE